MKRVTGCHIAYAAVQVSLLFDTFIALASLMMFIHNELFQARFALSDKDNWKDDDDHFRYSDFYNEIINVFEDDPKDEKIIETLNFWNQYAIILSFGNI